MTDQLVVSSPAGGVILLTLDRPRQRNALSGELIHGIAMERQAVGRAFESEDRVAGMTAFSEKRPPRFAGR